jgi:hypothetical protein
VTAFGRFFGDGEIHAEPFLLGHFLQLSRYAKSNRYALWDWAREAGRLPPEGA